MAKRAIYSILRPGYSTQHFTSLKKAQAFAGKKYKHLIRKLKTWKV